MYVCVYMCGLPLKWTCTMHTCYRLKVMCAETDFCKPLSTSARNLFQSTWSFFFGSQYIWQRAVNSPSVRSECLMEVRPCLNRDTPMEPDRKGSKSSKCSETYTNVRVSSLKTVSYTYVCMHMWCA